jgi:hypothetical protein
VEQRRHPVSIVRDDERVRLSRRLALSTAPAEPRTPQA